MQLASNTGSAALLSLPELFIPLDQHYTICQSMVQLTGLNSIEQSLLFG